MNNKLVIAIFILLTSITTYSFEFESTVKFCEVMIEEAIDKSLHLGSLSEEELQKIKLELIAQCNNIMPSDLIKNEDLQNNKEDI